MTDAQITQTINLTIPVSELKKALSFVGRAVPDNAIVPIIQNVLFEVDGEVLMLTGSDLSITHKATLAVEYGEPASICIPYKELSKLLANLPDQPVSIYADLSNQTIRLTSNKGRYKLSGEPGEDYPKPKEWSEDRQITLAGEERDRFFSRLGTTLFAVTKAGKGLVRTECVCWSGNELVATNMQVLARMKGVPQVADKWFSMPTRCATLLAGMGSLATDDAMIRVNAQRIACRVGDYSLEGLLSQEVFPDYQMAFPNVSPIRWIVDRMELIGALKRALVMGDETTQSVQLNGFDGGTLTVIADNSDYGNEAVEKLTAEVDKSLSLCASGRYLIDSLSRLTGESVTFDLVGADRPMILTGDEPDEIMLVMPILPTYAVVNNQTDATTA